jgi:ribosomal protein S14
MAQRTGRSIGAIKKQLWLIRQKLRECVDFKMMTDTQGEVL